MGFYFVILILLIASIVLTTACPKYKQVLFLIWVVTFAVISGIRDNIGADFEAYVFIFNMSPKFADGFMAGVGYTDYGYWILNAAVRSLGGGHEILFFLTSFITTLTFYGVCRRIAPRYIIWSLLIFYSFFLLRFEFNTIRHGMMVMFVWMAFTYIPSKKFTPFLTYILIGASFHSLAYVMFPLYWLLDRKLEFKYVAMILGGFFLFSLAFDIFEIILSIIPDKSYISFKINYYIGYYYGGDDKIGNVGYTMGFFINLFLMVVFYLYRAKFADLKYYNVLFNSLVLSLGVTVLFNKYGVFVERFASIFYMSLMFIIPLIVSIFSKRNQIVIVIVLYLYCSLLLYKNLGAKFPNGDLTYIPYKTILD